MGADENSADNIGSANNVNSENSTDSKKSKDSEFESTRALFDEAAAGENSTEKEESDKKFRNAIKIAVAIVSVAIISVTAYILISFDNQGGIQEGKSLAAASPVLINSEVSSNGEDSFLSTVDGLDNTESAFVFANEGLTAEDVVKKVEKGDMVVVDVYITFTGNKSIDLLLNSLEPFRDYINNERVVLVVHPVATTVNASTFIPEGVAQVAAVDSTKAWEMLEESLASGSILLRSNYDDDVMAGLIVKDANDLGITDITKDTLEAAPFGNWVIENHDEVFKTVKDFVPAVIIDGEQVDNKKVNVLNTSELFAAIDKKILEKNN